MGFASDRMVVWSELNPVIEDNDAIILGIFNSLELKVGNLDQSVWLGHTCSLTQVATEWKRIIWEIFLSQSGDGLIAVFQVSPQ